MTHHPSSADHLTPPQLTDSATTEVELTSFIQEFVTETGTTEVVVNLSGGIDSNVTATLASEGLGSENVLGLILPADANTDENIYDALSHRRRTTAVPRVT